MDKGGPLTERDPLLALMRGPGRRGTPKLVQACAAANMAATSFDLPGFTVTEPGRDEC